MEVPCPHCSDAHPEDALFCPRAGKAISVAKISRGTVIDDKYRVVRRLASGGMGAVYEVVHERIGRRLAMKLILPELARDEDMKRRFEQEARAASAIGHENIVEITDMGTTSDGLPFLVMEFLEGRDLAALLEAEAPLPAKRACHIVGQILAALEAAHTRRIIHRDLKPENVFLIERAGDRDFVKLLDFGISKIAEGDEAKLRLTSTGLILGTPFYMSPEQARGDREIDRRSDLFAVGSILYQAVTGQRPFAAENLNRLLYQIVNGRLAAPRTINPDLDAGLERVVMKALAVKPRSRFQSAAEFREAVLGRRPVSVSEVRAAHRSGSGPAVDAYSATISQDSGELSNTQTPMAWSRAGEGAGSGRRFWMIGIGVAVAILVGVILLLGPFLRSPAPSKDGTTPDRSPTGTAMDTAKADARDTVRIRVRVEPRDARLWLDGLELLTPNFQVARGRRYTLVVRAPGYRTRTLNQVADTDQELVLGLVREVAPPPTVDAGLARRPPMARPTPRKGSAPRRRPVSRPAPPVTAMSARARPRPTAPRPPAMRRIRAITDI